MQLRVGLLVAKLSVRQSIAVKKSEDAHDRLVTEVKHFLKKLKIEYDMKEDAAQTFFIKKSAN